MDRHNYQSGRLEGSEDDGITVRAVGWKIMRTGRHNCQQDGWREVRMVRRNGQQCRFEWSEHDPS